MRSTVRDSAMTTALALLATLLAVGCAPDDAASAQGAASAPAPVETAIPASAERPQAAPDKPFTIVMLGDSITAGYGLPQEDALPAKLEAALHADGYAIDIVNAGVSGDTTAGGRARLDWALGDHPDAVLIALGGNDMLRALDPDAMRANLAAMIEAARAQNVLVMLAGMRAAENLGGNYAARFDAVFPDLAKAYGVPLYPFLLDGVATDPALNQDDGIHPNAKGVGVIIARLAPFVEKTVGAAAPRETGAAQ